LTQQKTATILLYTHPECNYSDAQRHDFVKQGVKFREIDVSLHPEAIPELERLTGGERITPVVVEGDKVTVGYHGVG
jgi:glutaredoxin